MPQRALIVAAGAAGDDAVCAGLAAAAAHAGVDAELMLPADENALRRRLQRGDVELLLYGGAARARAAGHLTLELASAAAAGELRAVNLRHFAALLAAAPGLRAVLLLLGGDAAAGFASVLVAAGVPAAMAWRRPAGASEPRALQAWFAGWRGGASWAELAALPATAAWLVEAAGALASPAPAAAGLDLGDGGVRSSGAARVDARGSVPAAAAASSLAGAAATPAAAAGTPSSSAQPDRAAHDAAAQQIKAKRAAGSFDVFLCHNGADKPAVRALARALQARGLLPWLDEWELPPGQPWQPLLEAQIARIRSAAVLVGAAGVGPWQQQELHAFLREFVARNAPVIPVLLPDASAAPELPLFLRAMTWVDFRTAEPDPMRRLEWGITGERPDWA